MGSRFWEKNSRGRNLKNFDVMVIWANGSISRPELKCKDADELIRNIEELIKSVATGMATELHIKEIKEDGKPNGLRTIGY